MEEIVMWYEVLRALLPQVYHVRLIREHDAIVVGSPYADEIAFVSNEMLAGMSTSDALRLIERQLRPAAVVPWERREAS